MENKFSPEIKKKFKKILIIQTAFIGDAILTTPIIRAMKSTFNEAEIDIIAIPETADVFLYNRNISNIITFNKRVMSKRLKSFFSIVMELRRKRYDLAVSIQSSMTSSLIMLLGGIKYRLGFPHQKFLTHTIEHKKGFHFRLRILRLMEALSREQFGGDTEMFWSSSEEEKVSEVLKSCESGKHIILAPGSAQFTKQWPKNSFGLLAKMLEDDGFSLFFIGGKQDRELGEEIILSHGLSTKNLCGKFSILESAALIKRADLVISNDSAPLHIANAVNTPVVAIFGPTVKKFGFYPYREKDKVIEIELDCRPCGKHGGDNCPLKHFNCMNKITPEMVYREVEDIFER